MSNPRSLSAQIQAQHVARNIRLFVLRFDPTGAAFQIRNRYRNMLRTMAAHVAQHIPPFRGMLRCAVAPVAGGRDRNGDRMLRRLAQATFGAGADRLLQRIAYLTTAALFLSMGAV